MSIPRQLAEQVLAIPNGVGTVTGLGETFAADPFTGTSRFRMPISAPAGHGGLAPSVDITYSSGAGAGICGVGWAFGVGSIRRGVRKGIPRFTDEDVFMLGDDELVPLADGYFVRRTEGSFARIRHVRSALEDFWVVTEKNGVRSIYGRDPQSRDGEASKITAWHLTEMRNPNNHAVTYTYVRDEKNHRAYLDRVEWALGAYRMELRYEERPDVLRSARSGVNTITRRRLTEIHMRVRHRDTDAFTTFDSYRFTYKQSPITGLSLLTTVTRMGIDAQGNTKSWPTLSLGYTTGEAAPTPIEVKGHAGRPLSDPDLQLVDLNGDGYPDLLESTSTGWLLRQNTGDGCFARAVPISGPLTRLASPDVFLSDMDGEGFADLVTAQGYYPNRGNGFETFRPFGQRPSFDLQGPDSRLSDLDGDGLGDGLVTTGDAIVTYRNLGGSGWAPAVVHPLQGQKLPRLSDPWTRLADTTGDGLADLVRVSRGTIEVYQNLGRGKFAEARHLPLPERLPADVQPDQIQLHDLTGSGAADVVVRLRQEAWIFPNGCGESLGAKRIAKTRALTAGGSVEAVDLLGSGVQGLLYTENGDRNAWTFYDLWGGRRPDLLETINNGMGAITTVRYGSALAHAARDRTNGLPWRFPLPYSVLVVNSITTQDQITGRRVGKRMSYHEGYHDAAEREFRGFGVVEQWDTEEDVADTSTSAPSRTVRFFDLGNGHRFQERYYPTAEELPRDEISNRNGGRRALRGMLIREEVFGEDGTPQRSRPYVITHHTYTVKQIYGPVEGGEQSFFPARTHTDSYHLERTVDARHVAMTTVYDSYGRVVESREKGQGRQGNISTPYEFQQTEALERNVLTQYLSLMEKEPEDYDGDYTPVYMLDRPSLRESYGVTPDGLQLLQRERFYYDGADYSGLGYPGSGTAPGLVRGNLSCKMALAFTKALLDEVYPSASGLRDALAERGHYFQDGTDFYVHTERYVYNRHGMVTGTKDPNGNETHYEYDARYELFPIKLIDAAGHPTRFTRGELPFHVEAVFDANGNTTSFTYDPAGLPASKSVQGKFVSGVWQGDPPTHPTEQYSYDFMTTPVTIVVKTRQERLGVTFDVTRYIDGLGRTIQERHIAEPDPNTGTTRYRVTGWQTFNHKGLVVKAYQPFFANTNGYSEGDTTTAALETRYDPLGRPIRVNHPDGTYETTAYHPWVQTAQDRNDNAGGIAVSDPRYGPHLPTFQSHLNTPTRKYVDALGREIAVSEDNGTERHVTRKVLDLKDQVIEVWDARALSRATWAFTYDGLGRPIFTRHTTALGDRYTLADAAGNPIWARDARSVEVARTFDLLNRPLVEMTYNGVDTKLRRQWRYVAYDENAPEFTAFQAKNLFNQVGEERDADGLRFFTYDWRGLVTSISHRFWAQKDAGGRAWDDPNSEIWTAGANWDPEIPAADRDSIPSYLELPDLTDATTLTIETIYDAAGRPTEVRYPEGMTSRHTYNAAGLLERVAVDRGTGTGAQVVEALAYNARGQLTYLKHGNGVETTREYDEALERLTRIFTRRVQAPTTHFQDLAYAYDPAGNPLQITDNLSGSSFAHNQIIPNTRTFGYDPRYRLIRATGKKHRTVRRKDPDVLVTSPDPNDYEPYTVTYAYDPVGNFTRNQEYTSGRVYYKGERIDLFNGDSTEAGSFTDPNEGNFRYDANGNMTHTPRHEELAYTQDNQVRYVHLNGGGQVRYFHHGDQRVLRLVQKNGVKALTLYLGLFEYHLRKAVSGYTKLVLQVQGHGRHAQAERVLAGSDPDSLNLFYHHSDDRGSGHVLTKDNGDLLSQEGYFPYGRASDRRDARNRYRFIGVERDEDTALCMAGPRTYDPVIARFLQGDPLVESELATSPFVYALANPMSRVDPSGYQPVPLPAHQRLEVLLGQYEQVFREGMTIESNYRPQLATYRARQILMASPEFGGFGMHPERATRMLYAISDPILSDRYGGTFTTTASYMPRPTHQGLLNLSLLPSQRKPWGPPLGPPHGIGTGTITPGAEAAVSGKAVVESVAKVGVRATLGGLATNVGIGLLGEVQHNDISREPEFVLSFQWFTIEFWDPTITDPDLFEWKRNPAYQAQGDMNNDAAGSSGSGMGESVLR